MFWDCLEASKGLELGSVRLCASEFLSAPEILNSGFRLAV